MFLNDLQAGPSSCGCGNDQCRWALDYGSPPTAAKTPGDDAAAKIVAELSAGHPGKVIIPVWVTECELVRFARCEGRDWAMRAGPLCRERLLAPLRPQLESAPQGDRRADRPGSLVRDVSA